jgi:uncharacterized iron-regulated membrane protein
MNLRTDVVRVYKDVHTWVGIVSGLALFIAFYAGAITMFETPLQRWASAPTTLHAPPSLEDAQRLIDATLAQHPEAAKKFTIAVETGPEQPARMSWQVRAPGADRHAAATHYASSFADDGSLQVIEHEPAPVAEFIDVLHQQVGLPFDHEIAMPIMGAIALLYALALVSGVIVLLPTLVQDLFALRLGRNLKRLWLDVHNVLGVFSLPFHVIMALTAVVFAFHDQFYDLQDKVNYDGRIREMHAADARKPTAPPEGARMLTPAEIVAKLTAAAPEFRPSALEYSMQNGRSTLRVAGTDPRHGHRAPVVGFAGVDPYTGEVVSTAYLPGHQNGWYATVTSFFALHFGNFGGTTVRWAYFLLGLAGAFLFYTGNLLWIESRRKLEKKRNGPVEQSRSTRLMGSLTIGITTGCMAGISLTIAAAKWLPGQVADVGAWHTGLYYAVFLGAVVWAFVRGAARAASELLFVCAITTLAIPLSSALTASGLLPSGWNHGGSSVLIDVVALVAALCFAVMARKSRERALSGRPDSVWAAPVPEQA